MAVQEGGRWLPIASVLDLWRVDDEWWREEPVARRFYEALLEDGRRLTFFLDERTGAWFRIRA